MRGIGYGLRVGGAEIGGEEEIPVGLHGIVGDVEDVLHAIVGHVVAHGPQQGEIPLRGAVSKLAEVDPQVALTVGNDVADVQVAVDAAWCIGHGIEELQGLLSVVIGHFIGFAIESLQTLFI